MERPRETGRLELILETLKADAGDILNVTSLGDYPCSDCHGPCQQIWAVIRWSQLVALFTSTDIQCDQLWYQANASISDWRVEKMESLVLYSRSRDMSELALWRSWTLCYGSRSMQAGSLKLTVYFCSGSRYCSWNSLCGTCDHLQDRVGGRRFRQFF